MRVYTLKNDWQSICTAVKLAPTNKKVITIYDLTNS